MQSKIRCKNTDEENHQLNVFINECSPLFNLLFPLVSGAISGFILLIFTWKFLGSKFEHMFKGVKTEQEDTYIPAQQPFPPIEFDFEVPLTNYEINQTWPRRAVAVMFLLSLVSNVETDDLTLFISAGGKVCRDKSCTVTHTTLTPLLPGSLIKFIHPNNEVSQVVLEEFSMVETFKLVYLTSAYEVVAESTFRCRNYFNKECWDGSCNHYSNYDTEVLDIKLPHENFPHAYGCTLDTMRCEDSNCLLNIGCVRYKYVVKEKGILGKVFKKMSRSWEAKIVIKKSNSTHRATLSPENPLDYLSLDRQQWTIPVQLVSGLFNEIETSYNLLEYQRKYYYVVAAEPNFPVEGMIGDYQLSINSMSRAFDVRHVRCVAKDCNALCDAPYPTFERFSKNKNQARAASDVKLVHDLAQVKTPMVGSVTVLFTSDVVDHLEHIPAKCKFKQIGEYACTGCNELSYVCISSTNIDVHGIILFESNCSFDQNYLSCSERPSFLYTKYPQNFCELFFPILNETIIVEINTIFKGQMTPLERQAVISEGIYSTSVVFDFLSYFGLSTTAIFIAGFVAAVLFKGVVRLWMR